MYRNDLFDSIYIAVTKGNYMNIENILADAVITNWEILHQEETNFKGKIITLLVIGLKSSIPLTTEFRNDGYKESNVKSGLYKSHSGNRQAVSKASLTIFNEARAMLSQTAGLAPL